MARYSSADLANVIRTEGSVTRVLAGYPVDGGGEKVPGPRLRAITRAMEAAGSPDSDVATATATLEERSDDRDQVARLLLIRNGELLLDESLPDVALGANDASFGPLPQLLPLILQRQSEFPFVLLEASAGMGRIRTFLAGQPHAATDETVVGEHEHLHEAHSGGLSHFRHAHHTEEVWKRNETELAELVNRLMEHNDISLVVVTGDPHVVDLVTGALSSRAKAVLEPFTSDTLAAGASAAELDDFLEGQLRRLAHEHVADVIDRAGAQEGRDNSEHDERLQPIVHALQQAGVHTLLLDLEALESHSLLSLAGEPWVAAVAAETFGAATLGTGSAAEAMMRAAVVTDAEVVIVEHGSLPGGASAAMIHR